MTKLTLRIIGLIITIFVITYCSQKSEGPKIPQVTPTTQKPSDPFALDKPNVSPIPQQIPAGTFHGNKKTKVFHSPGCPAYNCPNCKVYFKSKRQAKRNGYRPHACTKPKKYQRKKHKKKRGEP